jgi:hypothetical protein
MVTIYICSMRRWRFKQGGDRKQEECYTLDCTNWHWTKGKIVNQECNKYAWILQAGMFICGSKLQILDFSLLFFKSHKTSVYVSCAAVLIGQKCLEFTPYLQLLLIANRYFVLMVQISKWILKFIDTNFRSDGQVNSFCSKFYSICLDRLEKITNLKQSVSFISWGFKFRTARIISTGPLPCVACSLELYNTILNSVYCGGKLLPGSYYQLSKTEIGYSNPFEIRVHISTLAYFQKRNCELNRCSWIANIKMPKTEYKF